jgi:hypothetical protein
MKTARGGRAGSGRPTPCHKHIRTLCFYFLVGVERSQKPHVALSADEGSKSTVKF